LGAEEEAQHVEEVQLIGLGGEVGETAGQLLVSQKLTLLLTEKACTGNFDKQQQQYQGT
jgi:hypothetical protein